MIAAFYCCYCCLFVFFCFYHVSLATFKLIRTWKEVHILCHFYLTLDKDLRRELLGEKRLHESKLSHISLFCLPTHSFLWDPCFLEAPVLGWLEPRELHWSILPMAPPVDPVDHFLVLCHSSRKGKYTLPIPRILFFQSAWCQNHLV